MCSSDLGSIPTLPVIDTALESLTWLEPPAAARFGAIQVAAGTARLEVSEQLAGLRGRLANA